MSNTTDTVVLPWWYGAVFVWMDERTWWSLMEVRSGWSPWRGGTTLCQGLRPRFCPDARQCPTSHGQSRTSLPGAGRHRRHGVASAIPRLESDWAFVGHPPETCFRASEPTCDSTGPHSSPEGGVERHIQYNAWNKATLGTYASDRIWGLAVLGKFTYIVAVWPIQPSPILTCLIAPGIAPIQQYVRGIC